MTSLAVIPNLSWKLLPLRAARISQLKVRATLATAIANIDLSEVYFRKPDFDSCISLAAGEIFVSKHLRRNWTPNFLHLVNKIFVAGGNLPKQVLDKGIWGATNYVRKFFIDANIVSDARNEWVEIWLKKPQNEWKSEKTGVKKEACMQVLILAKMLICNKINESFQWYLGYSHWHFVKFVDCPVWKLQI